MSCGSHLRSGLGVWRGDVGSRSRNGNKVMCLVRGEENGCVGGPQWTWGGPEQCRAQEGGLDEGGGAHRVTQSQWVSCNCAQGWLSEWAGQEAGCQALGQLLLQGQLGLQSTGERGEWGTGGTTGERDTVRSHVYETNIFF